MASADNKSMLFSRRAAVAVVALGVSISQTFAEETLPAEPPEQTDVCSMLVAELPSDPDTAVSSLPLSAVDHLRSATAVLESFKLDDDGTQSLLDVEVVVDMFGHASFQEGEMDEMVAFETSKIMAFHQAMDYASDAEPWDKFNLLDQNTRVILMEQAVAGMNAYFSLLDPDMMLESGLAEELDAALAPLAEYLTPEFHDWDPMGCGVITVKPEPLQVVPGMLRGPLIASS